jgi:hypothetical protein
MKRLSIATLLTAGVTVAAAPAEEAARLNAPPPISVPAPIATKAAKPSPRPSDADWVDAPTLALARSDQRCEARRLREWVRVSCRIEVTEIELIAGSAEGVALSHSARYLDPPDEPWQYPSSTDDAHIVFPTRPGDRRLFQVLDSAFVKWGGVDLNAALAISETWLPDEPAPTITIH